MSERSAIEWTDSSPTGRRLGAYKTAARRCGCTLGEWMAHRAAGRHRCFRCKEWKPREDFSVDQSRNGGLASSCKDCTSDASTAARYGMTLLQLHEFRAAHGNACGICTTESQPLYIDHDHATGKARGLLCPGCNTAIGVFEEDPALFAAALAYLEKHRG